MPSSYTLGEHFEQFVKSKIESGRYSSASEVVRNGLRLLEDFEILREAQLQTLRTQVQDGASSGAGLPADALLARLEAKYSAQQRKA